MANSVDAFKRLLQTIPKEELNAETEQLYPRYYNLARQHSIEMFIRPHYIGAITDASQDQHEYDTLYSKYKEMIRLSKSLFDLTH